MRLGEISDAAWVMIAPLLRPSGRSHGWWRDLRQVLESIVFTLRTGLQWGGTCPSGSAPWQTVHGRFARWSADGTYDHLLAVAQARTGGLPHGSEPHHGARPREVIHVGGDRGHRRQGRGSLFRLCAALLYDMVAVVLVAQTVMPSTGGRRGLPGRCASGGSRSTARGT
ncbi:transposase [Streptomyces sp. NPDC001250]|uniref:transposase n=1 Tax=unclassified Streptomyces TaxID=2593676 RepID=UPI003317CD00